MSTFNKLEYTTTTQSDQVQQPTLLNDFVYVNISVNDYVYRAGISRSSLGGEYDSNVNAFNFNEMILNDILLFSRDGLERDLEGEITSFSDITN